MDQTVQVPGVGPVIFPDGMSDDAISTAIQKNYPNLAPKVPAPAPIASGPPASLPPTPPGPGRVGFTPPTGVAVDPSGPHQLDAVLSGLTNIPKGVAKAAGTTAWNLGNLGNLAFIGKWTDPDARPDILKPKGGFQSLGYGGERVGEFMSGMGEVGAGADVLEGAASSLPGIIGKVGAKLARPLTEAAGAYGITRAQGGSNEEGLSTAALGGTAHLAAPLGARLASAAVGSSGSRAGKTLVEEGLMGASIPSIISKAEARVKELVGALDSVGVEDRAAIRGRVDNLTSAIDDMKAKANQPSTGKWKMPTLGAATGAGYRISQGDTDPASVIESALMGAAGGAGARLASKAAVPLLTGGGRALNWLGRGGTAEKVGDMLGRQPEPDIRLPEWMGNPTPEVTPQPANTPIPGSLNPRPAPPTPNVRPDPAWKGILTEDQYQSTPFDLTKRVHGSTPVTVYHGTPASNLDSIREQGLLPRNDRANNVLGVYASTDPWDAQWYRGSDGKILRSTQPRGKLMSDRFVDPEVDEDTGEIGNFERGPGDSHNARVRGSIPPESLDVSHDAGKTWEPVIPKTKWTPRPTQALDPAAPGPIRQLASDQRASLPDASVAPSQPPSSNPGLADAFKSASPTLPPWFKPSGDTDKDLDLLSILNKVGMRQVVARAPDKALGAKIRPESYPDWFQGTGQGADKDDSVLKEILKRLKSDPANKGKGPALFGARGGSEGRGDDLTSKLNALKSKLGITPDQAQPQPSRTLDQALAQSQDDNMADLLTRSIAKVKATKAQPQSQPQSRSLASRVPGSTPTVMYHGTDASSLPGILSDGLDPAHAGRNWGASENSVYLTDTLSSASSYAKNNSIGTGAKPIVLRITTPRGSLMLDKGSTGGTNLHDALVRNGAKVDPANIEVKVGKDWMKLSDYANTPQYRKATAPPLSFPPLTAEEKARLRALTESGPILPSQGDKTEDPLADWDKRANKKP